MRVNKAELTQMLGCSLPTLNVYMTRYGDAFPVLTQGGRGRDWSFDHEAVVAFLNERREADAQADTERQAALRQFALPLGHNGGPPIDAAPCVRPADQLTLMKVRKLRREEEYACGRLVEAAKVSEALSNLLRELNRAEHKMVRSFGLRHRLSEDLIADLDKALSECQRDLVRFIQSLIPPEDTEPTLFARAAE